MEKLNTKTSTIVRTVCLFVALANQILTATGHSPIPVDNEEIQQLISITLTVITSLVAWWKNNSFTLPAKQADIWMKEMKAKEKKG